MLLCQQHLFYTFCVIKNQLGVTSIFLHKWRHVPCVMTSSIISLVPYRFSISEWDVWGWQPWKRHIFFVFHPTIKNVSCPRLWNSKRIRKCWHTDSNMMWKSYQSCQFNDKNALNSGRIFFQISAVQQARVQATHIWMLCSWYACSNFGLISDVFAWALAHLMKSSVLLALFLTFNMCVFSIECFSSGNPRYTCWSTTSRAWPNHQ